MNKLQDAIASVKMEGDSKKQAALIREAIANSRDMTDFLFGVVRDMEQSEIKDEPFGEYEQYKKGRVLLTKTAKQFAAWGL